MTHPLISTLSSYYYPACYLSLVTQLLLCGSYVWRLANSSMMIACRFD